MFQWELKGLRISVLDLCQLFMAMKKYFHMRHERMGLSGVFHGMFMKLQLVVGWWLFHFFVG